MINKKIAGILGLIALGGIGGDLAIQTQSEVTDIITAQQEQCLRDTGKYCQYAKNKINADLFGTKIKEHNYDIVVDIWEGGKGVLRDQQGYTIRYIEPIIPFVNGTTTP